MDQRVALVTGGARGIGRAIALALAADGRAVAVADLLIDDARQTAEAAAEHGVPAIAVEIDVTDSASVRDAVERATNELGRRGARQQRRLGRAAAVPRHRRVVLGPRHRHHFKGALRTTKAVLPAMVAAGWGRVVNIASDAGRVGSSHESVYSGAKGGVIAFTKTIAREVARSGVTANTVCPGPTRTPLLDGMAGEGEAGRKLVASLERAVWASPRT